MCEGCGAVEGERGEVLAEVWAAEGVDLKECVIVPAI